MQYEWRMASFASLDLAPALAKAIEVLGFVDMTPVQEQTLPLLLQGQDVIAQAQTGSGKTAAFGLALLSRVRVTEPLVQGLVLCPTRELADQITAELRRLARFIPNVRVVTLTGGVPVRTQTPGLTQPPHIVVGTPGRVLDHVRRRNVDLRKVSQLVLDEADRMLDMGFREAIEDVVKGLPRQRQTLLFSATYNDEVRATSRSLQTQPAEVTVSAQATTTVQQIFHEVEAAKRFDALLAVLQHHQPESALIFCHTRNDTRDVAERLARAGFAAAALHGELEQRERDEVLLRFAHRSCTLLVATDVAARGLDIKALPLVIAWELPNDPDVHTHRVGRTGRAGEAGLAVALCAAAERNRAAAIEAAGAKVQWQPLPPTQGTPAPAPAPMMTFVIEAGRDDKLRPADVLGALTQELGIAGTAVGKIDIGKTRAYVSIARAAAQGLATKLHDERNKLKLKGKSFRAFSL